MVNGSLIFWPSAPTAGPAFPPDISFESLAPNHSRPGTIRYFSPCAAPYHTYTPRTGPVNTNAANDLVPKNPIIRHSCLRVLRSALGHAASPPRMIPDKQYV